MPLPQDSPFVAHFSERFVANSAAAAEVNNNLMTAIGQGNANIITGISQENAARGTIYPGNSAELYNATQAARFAKGEPPMPTA